MRRSWNRAACGRRIGMCGYTSVPADGRTCFTFWLLRVVVVFVVFLLACSVVAFSTSRSDEWHMSRATGAARPGTCRCLTECPTRADIWRRATELPDHRRQDGDVYQRQRAAAGGRCRQSDAPDDRHAAVVQWIFAGFHPGQIHHQHLITCRFCKQRCI